MSKNLNFFFGCALSHAFDGHAWAMRRKVLTGSSCFPHFALFEGDGDACSSRPLDPSELTDSFVYVTVSHPHTPVSWHPLPPPSQLKTHRTISIWWGSAIKSLQCIMYDFKSSQLYVLGFIWKSRTTEIHDFFFEVSTIERLHYYKVCDSVCVKTLRCQERIPLVHSNREAQKRPASGENKRTIGRPKVDSWINSLIN